MNNSNAVFSFETTAQPCSLSAPDIRKKAFYYSGKKKYFPDEGLPSCQVSTCTCISLLLRSTGDLVRFIQHLLHSRPRQFVLSRKNLQVGSLYLHQLDSFHIVSSINASNYEKSTRKYFHIFCMTFGSASFPSFFFFFLTTCVLHLSLSDILAIGTIYFISWPIFLLSYFVILTSFCSV